MRYLNAAAGFLLVCAAAHANAAESYPQRMGYDKAQSMFAGWGSYIGLANYCLKYKIDFRDAGARIQERMNHHPYWADADPQRQNNLNKIFLVSRQLGEQGYLYVRSEDAFLNTPKPGMSMEYVCRRANEEIIDVAKGLP